MPENFLTDEEVGIGPQAQSRILTDEEVGIGIKEPNRIAEPWKTQGPQSTTWGGPALPVDFETDFRGPAQTISDALSEAYGIGTGDVGESLLGIRPEGVPTGAEITEATGIPKAITIPASAAGRAVAGAAQYITSPKGLVEAGISMLPGVGLLQKAKWFYDMAKGAGEVTGDLSVKLEQALRNPKDITTDDIQSIAEDTANTALMLFGSGKLASHEFARATGIRAPLGRMVESEKTRLSKDLAEQLKKAPFDPTATLPGYEPAPPVPPEKVPGREAESVTPVPAGEAPAKPMMDVLLAEFPHLQDLVREGAISAVNTPEELSVGERFAKRPDLAPDAEFAEGRVVFNAANFVTPEGMIDRQLVRDKVVHEVAIHKGLREALGPEEFSRISGQVWKSLSPEERNAIIERNLIESGEVRQIVGEEWIAYEAERVMRSGVTNTIWTKIADTLRQGLRAIGIGGRLTKLSDTEIANLVARGWKGIESLDKAKEFDIPDAAKQTTVAVSDVATPPASVNPVQGVATPKFSVRTWKATDKAKLVNDIVRSGVADQVKAQKWIDDVSTVAAFIIRNKDQLDYTGSAEFSSLKKNADAYYTLSEDYSTICRKGAKLLATVTEIMKQTGGLTSEQMWKVRDLLRQNGDDVTCAACYVWSRKINIGPQLDAIAAKFPNVPKDVIYDPGKSDILKADYPEAWDELMSKGSGVGKAFEVRTEYNRDVLTNPKVNPEFVRKQNLFSGLRSQSWSDFEVYHLIDKMQSAIDKALVGLMGHSYTKVPEYVELVAATGEMTNMSLIPKGNGLDAMGRLVFDDIEGMPFTRAMQLRRKYDKTAGTIVIGANDAHILAAMKDPRIDYIIPYHKSGLNVELRNASEMASWMDYEKSQKEGVTDANRFSQYMAWKKSQGFNKAQKEVRPWEYWDKKATGDQNATNYLRYCEENGIAPKFPQFAGKQGYWKLLVDRRMYDNAGKYIEQRTITPTFDMGIVNRLLDGYLKGDWKGAGDATPNMDVVREVIGERKMERTQREQIIREFRQAGEPTEPVLMSVSKKDPALQDIAKMFEPIKKVGVPAKKQAVNIIESARTGFSSKFRPTNALAEDIAKAYPVTTVTTTPTGTVKVTVPRKAKDIAGILEQLKGSQGKAEAQIYRFDRDVTDLVGKDTLDFNVYVMLRRSLDRLRQDEADIQTFLASPEAKTMPQRSIAARIKNLRRRSVGNYTIPQLEQKLNVLESKLGPNNLRRFQIAADRYQNYMDAALKLQVDSGRMSQEVYNEIKAGNQFYAPFKLSKYFEETGIPEGTGRKVDTVADFTKAMKGIESQNIRLGDMLGAARQSILISRILADKAYAMRLLSEQAAYDTQGLFVKRLKSGMNPPTGWKTVNVYEKGIPVKYATRPEVADALQLFSGNGGGIVSSVLGYMSIPFKAGATALNVPFQVSNLVADVPRSALVSKYGIRTASDLIRYPLDFAQSLLASMQANLVGKKSDLYLDFLDSGAAGTTIQDYLTPEALKWKDPASMSTAKRVALGILYSPAEFSKAIEQTSKIMGIKRAMRFEKVKSGEELSRKIPEAVTEVRRFSGSPDFGRQGRFIETARLNLIYMFLNARIQGAVADIGRLAGRDGSKTAAITWFRLATAVGVPTAYLYFLNNSPEYKDDYEKRPKYEKDNYWLIPKDTFITTEEGEKMRDYWRVPKRESSKWIGNMVESALDFAQKRDPEGVVRFGTKMLEDIFPVNITGETAQERLESVGASLNPVIKAPLEMATGRNMFRHRQLVPESMKKASPEEQYTDRTSEAFKTLAKAIPDVAPEVIRSPIMLENLTRNLTAGLLTQFMSGKPVEGRTPAENAALMQRFQAIPYTDNEDFMKELRSLERESADEYLQRHRAAKKIMDENPDLSLGKLMMMAKTDPKVMNLIADMWISKKNGATYQDKLLISLPARQRAQYLDRLFSGMTAEEKRKAIIDFAKKRVLTEAVFREMALMKR